jgi:FixJ family two-component response regulator
MIYIIEDDNHVRKALELVIHSNGYTSHSFSNAKEFLVDPLIKGREDILILDMNMKGLHGRDFLRELNSLRSPMSIIGITAHDDVEIRSFCRAWGVKALLTKPVDSKALLDLIKYHGEIQNVL